MNRELKFRVWCQTDDGAEMIHLDNEQCDNGIWFAAAKHIEQYKSIMQYTGLKDKNGIEIYEGDIVADGDIKMLVGWHKKYASFVLKKEGWLHDHFFGEASDPESCEVIGNIHQNKELL